MRIGPINKVGVIEAASLDGAGAFQKYGVNTGALIWGGMPMIADSQGEFVP